MTSCTCASDVVKIVTDGHWSENGIFVDANEFTHTEATRQKKIKSVTVGCLRRKNVSMERNVPYQPGLLKWNREEKGDY